MPIKSFPLELKSVSEQGVFEGYAATYGNVDLGGDVLVKGCFATTLAQGGSQRPLLYQHTDLIGTVDLTDSPTGLAVKGKLTLAVQRARETYELLKAGALKACSIGYSAVGGGDFQGGVRYLPQVKLFEVSLVWAPMNESALVTSVKSRDDEERLLREFRRELKIY